MKTIRFILLITVFHCSLQLFSQAKQDTVTIRLLKIKNSTFDSVLNDIISSFKKCESYSTSFVFAIVITKKKPEKYLIRIDPVENKNLILNKSIRNIFGKPYGCLYYSGHLLIVSGMNPDDLFIQSNRTERFFSNNEPLIPIIADYTIWYYSYNKGTIELLKVENECGNE
jgi:hypothetical protein